MKVDVLTYSDAAEQLGIKRQTVADLSDLANLEPKPVPYSGHGKGLDPDDIGVLEDILDYARSLAKAS